MIYTSEKDYLSTKLIKQGKEGLDPSFSRFAEWVFEEFGVKPINVIYDQLDPNNPHRLNLIFERQDQAKVFHQKDDAGYHEVKRKHIAEKFKELNTDPTIKGAVATAHPSNIWVIFQEFEPEAKSSCNEQIPQQLIEDFKLKFQSKNLWEVLRFGAYTTFLFFTDEQKKESKESGLQEEIRKEYLQLLKKYDEFDYFCQENLPVLFDSKENFDKNSL